MRYLLPLAFLAGTLALEPARCRAADAFQLMDGDRVVLIGSTLIEREQRHGYWETALTSRYPDRNITFRNLGWSGDTVFGEARAGFGSAADGFRELKEHVAALKPTVIIVGYGTNESFAGEAGLPHFREGLTRLLDTVGQTKARIVLLAPPRQEDLGRPLPDPTEHNRLLRLYRDALRDVAAERGHAFVDLYELLADGATATPPAPLTDNGLHFTAYGYWRCAAALERGFGWQAPAWVVEIDKDGKTPAAQGTKLTRLEASPLRFTLTDHVLPAPAPPKNAPAGATLPGVERVLRIRGLAPGKYVLQVDGKAAAAATAAEWAAGVKLARGPEFDQVERLRQTILEKNRLYFHRWRPENVTYLTGFRKNEQGKNASEIPKFDPLIARLEAEIARLRVPVSHSYELVAEKEAGR